MTHNRGHVPLFRMTALQPFPQNLETAKELESIVRQYGATPATIAILNGALTVGFDGNQLADFASLPPASVLKASRRDICVAVAKKVTAATTVASTMCVGVVIVHSGNTTTGLSCRPCLFVYTCMRVRMCTCTSACITFIIAVDSIHHIWGSLQSRSHCRHTITSL